MAYHNELGKIGEKLAAKYLINKGYEILAQNKSTSTGQQGGDDDASTPDDEITTATEYDEDTMSLMGQSFMTGATGYSRRRRRHKGAANTRVASAKEAEIQAGAKSKGWIGSIQEAASKTVTPGGTRTSVPLGVNCN